MVTDTHRISLCMCGSGPTLWVLWILHRLEQWGLTRREGESLAEFLARLKDSPAWFASKDISLWDLRPDGAAEFKYVVTLLGPCMYQVHVSLCCAAVNMKSCISNSPWLLCIVVTTWRRCHMCTISLTTRTLPGSLCSNPRIRFQEWRSSLFYGLFLHSWEQVEHIDDTCVKIVVAWLASLSGFDTVLEFATKKY